MHALVLSLLLPMTVVAAEPVSAPSGQVRTASYAQAYNASVPEGRPMLVVIKARWCHVCTDLDHVILPELARRGALENVEVAVIDYDKETTLARSLMRGSSVPQVILYSSPNGKWQRRQYVGLPPIDQLGQLLRAAMPNKVATIQPASASSR